MENIQPIKAKRPRTVIVWLFWVLVYTFRRRPKGLGPVMTKGIRTWRPWWKFRPNLFHNDLGCMWEIHFDNQSTYVENRLIPLEVHVDQDTGDIRGFTVFDEFLTNDARQKFQSWSNAKSQIAG